MNPGALHDKIIFLTGGSTEWMGLRRRYAREGAKVALVARDKDATAKAAETLGVGHLGFAAMFPRSEVKSALSRVLEHYGRLDAIHNNAGMPPPVHHSI